jgi:multiple sugar transport system permease protein
MTRAKRAAVYLSALYRQRAICHAFLFALSSSLKKLDGVYAYPPSLLPVPPPVVQLRKAVTVLPFGQFLWNSTFLTLTCVVGQLLTGAMVLTALPGCAGRGGM